MGLLTKQDLLTKETLKTIKVEFEDGTYVFVRQMTGHERDQWERSLMRPVKNMQGKITGYEQSLEDFRAKLAVVTICDEQGTLLLQPTDARTFSESISAAKLIKIIEAAQKLNGISEEDKEDLIKNSEVGQADNSSSDSVES